MTEAAAAELLGVSVDEVTFTHGEVMGTCNYSGGALASIVFALYAEEDAGAAESEMAKVAEGLGFLATCEPQSDVGDAAVYCGGERADRLLVRQGATWIDVLGPGGLEAKKKVAEQVL